MFLSDRRAPASGSRAPAAADICPVTGRGRLSYPRAEYLFKTASAKLDPHRQGWTFISFATARCSISPRPGVPASIYADAPERYALWGLGLLIDMVFSVLQSRRPERLISQMQRQARRRVTAGSIATAAGLGVVAAEPAAHLHGGVGWVLGGGLAVYFAA
ncbi:hypothetical protein AB0L05_11515 [Nonomuraea pusilla]|uniref:hypothetical protein n=1 Tax=Nonomuraea pusilla TaxID=46177 RepID=UPI00332D67F4